MIRLPSTVMTYCNGYTGGYTVVCPYDEKLVEELKNSSFRYYNIGNKLIVIRLDSEGLNRLGLAGTVKTIEEVNDRFGEILKSVFFSIENRLSIKCGICRLTSFIDYAADLSYTRIGKYSIELDNQMTFNNADDATNFGKGYMENGIITQFGDPACVYEYIRSFNKLRNMIL